MSIEQIVTETIQVAGAKDRTFAVHLRCLYGSDYELEAKRERLFVDAAGVVVRREPLPDVVRKVSQVQDQALAMTLLTSVRDCIDGWAQEDAAAALEPAPEEPQP